MPEGLRGRHFPGPVCHSAKGESMLGGIYDVKRFKMEGELASDESRFIFTIVLHDDYL